MGNSLDPGDSHYEATVTLSGGGTVTFDAPHPELSDTPEVHPVEFWLKVCPTSDQGDPD